MRIPRRTALVVAGWSAAGVLAAGTLTGVGIAFASGSQVNGAAPAAAIGTATPTATPSGSAAPGPGKRGRPGFPGPRGRFGDLGRGLAGTALHGEFVVKDKDGKIVTNVVQHGQVTAVSTTSITLKSEDGFTGTYAVNGDTRVRIGGDNGAISGVKTGNEAWVTATKNGSSSTATILVVKT
jgi:hypothetical protein